MFARSERQLALSQPQGGRVEQPEQKRFHGPARCGERAGQGLPRARDQVQPGKGATAWEDGGGARPGWARRGGGGWVWKEEGNRALASGVCLKELAFE